MNNKNNNIIEELSWRGLIKQITDKEKILISQKLNKGVYCGFDPTSDSLHIGHLLNIILLERFRIFNFKPIIILGSSTASIGDPSGKNKERILLKNDIINKNILNIKNQLNKLINKDILLLDNINWWKDINLIYFLRYIGKEFNISYLLNKQNISSRINSGLSYAEFSYNLLQAFDFYKLYIENNCSVQVGGSDQWGNIVSGINLINKLIDKEESLACGLTIELLTDSFGNKLGKTSILNSENIWLDFNKTSFYKFYQFFLNQNDLNALDLLKKLTFLSEDEILILKKQHENYPKKKIIQKILAKEITIFVHGYNGFKIAEFITNILFKNNDNFHLLKYNDFEIISNQIPTYFFKKNDIFLDFLISSNIIFSKKKWKEFVLNKSIIINGKIIIDYNLDINKFDFYFNKYLLLKKGKKNYYLIIKL